MIRCSYDRMKMKRTQKSAKERVMRKLRVIGALQIAAAKAKSVNSVQPSSPIAVISTGTSTMPPAEIESTSSKSYPDALLTTIDLESSLSNGFQIQPKLLRSLTSVQ